MSDAIRLSPRADLAAVVPHLLGFAPENSLVCVPSQSGGPTARVDLPSAGRDLDEVIDALSDAYRRHQKNCPSISLLAFTADEAQAFHALEGLAARLTETQSIDTALWVDFDTWTDVRTGETGLIDEGTRDRISAEFVIRGRTLPKPSRQALARDLDGDSTGLASILPANYARVAGMSLDDLADEGGWALCAIDKFSRSGIRPSDSTAARIVAAISQPALRDLVVAQHTQSNAETMSSLWRDLARRTPRHHVAPIAEVLAFSCWLSGDGAAAWTAIDLIGNRAEHGLAELVAQAIAVAAPPRIWDQAVAPQRSPNPEHDKPSH